MTDIDKSKNSFIFNFLTNPKYRIWRHLSIILAAAIMSLNQVVMGYHEIIPSIGNIVYIWIIYTFLSYAVIIYINLYILIPKYLLKRKYFAYLMYMILLILFAIFSQDIAEYTMYRRMGMSYNYLPILASNIPSLLVNLICLGGISIPVYLRNWLLYKHKVNQLEKTKIYSEVEQLKEQVNPTFLFAILNRTGLLSSSDPEKASAMLMKLSQLLRYQLYDCNREKVLLSSEVNFLKNYLELVKQYSPDFVFSITAEGDTYKTFIPPLLFLTFIQNAIRATGQNKTKSVVEVCITTIEDEISLICKAKNSEEIALSDSEYGTAKQRLEILYRTDYTLSVVNDKALKESTVNLKLKNCRL